MSDRADLIVKYFDFLINEYHFRMERKEFDPQMMGNAVVVFKSSKFGLEIVIDRNQVLISIGEQLDARREWFEFSDVVKYYSPEAEDAYVLPDKTPENTWDDVVENQLRRLSVMLRQYCQPLLKGELWMKEELKKIEKKRAAEMYKKFGQGHSI
jgi:hypothetical protein